MNKALSFLVSLLFAGMCLSVSPATAADITLSYANFPPAPTFPCVQMEHWAAEVEKRTKGAVDVQTYPGSTLLGAKNMWDGVIQGQADIGCISLSYQPGVFPMLSVLEQPFGFSSATVASLALYDLWERHQPEEFNRVKVLTMFTSAPSNIMSKVAVRDLSDLKGLEIRASGGASTVMKLLGASPVSMPASETPEALQKGLVKGVFSSFDWLKDFNFAEYLPYATVTNLQVYPFAVIMNKQSWERLPSEVKQVFDDLRREQSLWTGSYLDDHIEESLAWSKEKYDLEVITLAEEQLAAANRRLSVMVQDWKATARAAGIDADAVVADLLASKALLEERYGR
ncbi:MAG: TRAP transporter substrate-binding protein [Desulfohalobiaceae bacterium]